MDDQCCNNCYFYDQIVEKCKNPESAWERLERRPTEGIYCPDWSPEDA